MLWVLKRTVSMRRFFWAPKKYVKTDGLENIYNFILKICVYLNLWLLSIFRYLRKAVDLDILSQARNNQEVKVSLVLDPKLRVLKDKLSSVNLVSLIPLWIDSNTVYHIYYYL